MAHVWSSKTIDANELADLYEWLDVIPLSRPRTHVEKDFADGVLAAEIVKFYFPDIVDMRFFLPCQNVQDRITQWKELNVKVFRKIGLNIPSHVMTQLSIAKSGIAQIFLSNLRASLTLAGANTSLLKPIPLIPEPPMPIPMRAYTPYTDPWYRYNYGAYGAYPPDRSYLINDDYDYYWNKRYSDRVLRSARGLNATKTVLPAKAISQPTLRSRAAVLPPLAVAPNPYVAESRMGLAAAKLELDDRNQKITEKDDEVQFLRGQLKRMEVLLQSKNFKIQEMQIQLDKLKAPKKY